MQRSLDHIVLNVKDLERAIRFYTEVMGLAPERIEEYRQGKAPFPSVRISADTVIDLLPPDWWQGQEKAETHSNYPNYPNMGHFCLAVEREEWQALQGRLRTHGISIHSGPVPRWGARGNGVSIYFYDPEGNEIEVRHYQ